MLSLLQARVVFLGLIVVASLVMGCRSSNDTLDARHQDAGIPEAHAFEVDLSPDDAAKLADTRTTLRAIYAPEEWTRHWSASDVWSSYGGWFGGEGTPVADLLAFASQLGVDVVTDEYIGGEAPLTIELRRIFNYADQLNIVCQALRDEGLEGISWHASGSTVYLNANFKTTDRLIVGEYTIVGLPPRSEVIERADWRWPIESVATELRRSILVGSIHAEKVEVTDAGKLRVTATAHRHLLIQDRLNGTPLRHMHR
jgi:hypothetical protein